MVSIHSTNHLKAYASLQEAVNKGLQLPEEMKNYNSIFCTGSVITKYLVLTAAQCFPSNEIDRKEEFFIMANSMFSKVGYSPKVYQVEDFIWHENFVPLQIGVK